MDIFIIALLFLMTMVLMAVEIFLTPGISIAGMGAIICFSIGNFLTFELFGLAIGTGVLVASLIVTAILAYWMFNSNSFKRYTLKKSIDSTSATDDQLSISVGDEGIATTRLALIGMANFKGRIVEVKSSGDFIDEGTPVIVTRTNNASIIVEKK